MRRTIESVEGLKWTDEAPVQPPKSDGLWGYYYGKRGGSTEGEGERGGGRGREERGDGGRERK